MRGSSPRSASRTPCPPVSPESLLSGLMEGEWVLCLGRGLHLAQGVCSSHLPSPLLSMGSKASPSKSFCQALSSVSLGREGFQSNVSNIPCVCLPLYGYAHSGHQDRIPELCELRQGCRQCWAGILKQQQLLCKMKPICPSGLGGSWPWPWWARIKGCPVRWQGSHWGWPEGLSLETSRISALLL